MNLGIPGSPPAAMLLGALMLHGVTPGPMITFEHPTFIMEVAAILLLASLAMFVTGLGLGPITSILTAVIQSTSPPETMGVATSALTTFRQLGASIWLAIGGSYFTSVFDDRLPGQLRASGVPDELAAGLTGGGGTIGSEQSTVVGDLGATILAAVPDEARAMRAEERRIWRAVRT